MAARRPRRQAAEDQARVISRYDGVARSLQAEETVTEAVTLALSSPVGRQVLDYLRSITLHRVLPPGAPDAELREIEGQRRLVAGLIARMNDDDRRRRDAVTEEN